MKNALAATIFLSGLLAFVFGARALYYGSKTELIAGFIALIVFLLVRLVSRKLDNREAPKPTKNS